MSKHIDLTNLRTMTDGDKEMEQELFDIFYSSSEEAIRTLSANCVDGHSETWRTAAHAFKGSAYNVGAKILGNLCCQAQDNPSAAKSQKTALLDQMKSEYEAVKKCLQQIHTT